jgi:hypothetical protein
VETASFDIQKLKNPEIFGVEYQNGEQLGWLNVRQYVMHRDNHQCQHCKGKKKDERLEVHHIESRRIGGERPENLVTLCLACHKDYHAGKIKLNIKKKSGFRNAAFMGIMRKTLLERLMSEFNDVEETFGYITKYIRKIHNIPKSHSNDAFAISQNALSKRCDSVFEQKFVRKNNRSLFKLNQLKGGRWKANKAEYLVKGFRLFDKVLAEKEEWFIFGRRKSGFFDLRKLCGEKLNKGSYSCKRISLLDISRTLLIERM